MAALKVNSQVLRTTADEFQTHGTNISNIINEVTAKVNSFQSNEVWTGDKAAQFASKFALLQNDFEQLNGMVREHVEDLKAMADKYEQAESSNESLTDALATDVIE
ncbi:MAG: WXG100 family type VII secretion target [Clostridia bacterium]|nr:WXG100 family type VII secretion target [Clostridia bacterium]NCC44102.1 WXG100 family type VII secretion target [Clostridia bacterium]